MILKIMSLESLRQKGTFTDKTKILHGFYWTDITGHKKKEVTTGK
jgi:hypothetical protein